MKRRDFVRLGWATMIAGGAGRLRPAFAESVGGQRHRAGVVKPKAAERAADFTLQIAPMIVELAPQVVVSTVGYNNQVPGPLLRVREGQHIAVDVVNDTDVPEFVHWHGQFVPSEVDGAEEEGTPPVGPKGFTAPFCEIDFGVGGKFLYCMKTPDGQEYWNGGEYYEIVPQEKIVFLLYPADSKGNRVAFPHQDVEHEAIEGVHDMVLFEDVGNGQTKVTFVGNEPMKNAMETGQLEGTKQILEKFAAVVAGLVQGK